MASLEQRNRQVAEDLVEERKELERQKEAQWKELEQQQQHQLQLLLEQHQLEELERRRIFEQETQILEKVPTVKLVVFIVLPSFVPDYCNLRNSRTLRLRIA